MQNPASRLGLFACLLLILTSCGGVPSKSVFPPSLSIQQLKHGTDGRWEISLRIQNNSYTSLNYTAVNGTLALPDQIPLRLARSFNLDIAPLSGDILQLTVWPTTSQRQVFDRLRGSSDGVKYRISGIVTAQSETLPSTVHPFRFSYEGWLSPVPGLPHAYR